MSNITTDLVRSYLREIGRYSLLTPSQEISYAKLVQQMMAILHCKEALVQQLDRQPTDSELALELGLAIDEVQLILHQGQRAKQKMVTANLRLVVAIAKKYQNRNMEFLDLIQEGTFGLQKAVEKFDPNKGYKFSTYSYWFIVQTITRAISNKSRTIRLPVYLIEKLSKINKVQQQLSQSLGRKPRIEEIAIATKLTHKQVKEYLDASKQIVSLDSKRGDSQYIELIDAIPSQTISFDEYIHQQLLRHHLAQLLVSLPLMQREILVLRFGLLNEEQLTFRQIGQQLNISSYSVRQLLHEALNTLRLALT